MNSGGYRKEIKQKVIGAEVLWDIEKGTVKLEDDYVALFWAETTLKGFIDAIEEISGEEAAHLVLETAGYRTGVPVGESYRSKGDIAAIIPTLPNIWITSGWGHTKIESFCLEEKKIILTIKNSWEDIMIKAQGKTGSGPFLPAHWAGVFTGLLQETIWYEAFQRKTDTEEYIEVHLFPSSTIPVHNIHNLIRQKEQEQIRQLETMVAERTKELTKLVEELSVPVIPVLEHVVVIPLMATFDEKRADDLLQKALYGVKQYEAKYLILDVTGLKSIDDYTIQLVHKLVQSASLIGSSCILVGISPALGIQITGSELSLEGVECFATLQHAIHYSLAQNGRQKW
jgi:rsbT co-antagonist protein RsbR